MDVHLSLKFRSAQSGTRETRETRREIFFNFCTTRIALYAITTARVKKKGIFFERAKKKGTFCKVVRVLFNTKDCARAFLRIALTHTLSPFSRVVRLNERTTEERR